jgi:PKHD-type hydroxylase
MLLHIPGIFSSSEIADIRAALDNAEWLDGKVTAGYQSAKAKHNQQLAENDPLAREISATLLQRLWTHPLFVSAVLPSKVYPPLFNRYSEGGSFGYHVDNAVRAIKGSAERVRTDVSATLFFNDPDTYDAYGVQRVKLPAGDLVIYPSTSVHKVEPVTRGTRLASFFWIQSMVRDDADRTLLFQLDQAIQSLTADLPDHPALVQLTGNYHNLLRRWAEV